jgi:hypothetical protein
MRGLLGRSVLTWRVLLFVIISLALCYSSGALIATRGCTFANTMGKGRNPLFEVISNVPDVGGNDADGDDGLTTNIELNEEGVVYRKQSRAAGIPFKARKLDDRDTLPYKTFIMLDGKARHADKLHVATLFLDSLTACGDILDLGDKGVFEVVRVSFVYKWEVHGFAVTGKRLYVKKAPRRWIQKALQ